MNITVKMKFADLAKAHAGQVCILNYEGKSLTFTPLAEPQDSGLRCDCGHSVWNATNFGNSVHFCPGKVYEVVVTDYKAVKP